MKQKSDFEVHHNGSIVSIAPLTKAAREWVKKNLALEGWQWLGGFFNVETRYAEDILNGASADGLRCPAFFLL